MAPQVGGEHRDAVIVQNYDSTVYGRIVEQLEPEGAMLAIADMMRGGGCCSRVCR